MRTVYITPDSATIFVGGTQTFYVSTSLTPILADGTYTADGTIFADGGILAEEVTWESSDPNVATIDAYGVATAVAVGRTLITASGLNFHTSVELVVLAKVKYLQFGGGELVPITGDGIYTLTDLAGNTIDAMVEYDLLPDTDQSENVTLTKASQCNVWLAFNLFTKKWSKICASLANIPHATFKVVDENGKGYIYGLLNDGTTVILNSGSLWRGDSTQRLLSNITTSALIPTKNILDTTTLKLVKYVVEANSVTIINYARTDIAIYPQGIETGDLNVYGKIVYNPDIESAYFSGDNFYCKEVIESAVLPHGLKWQDANGVVSITGTIHENYKMKLTTAAGNFITAGFLKGSIVYTTDPHNLGPFQITDLTATQMTFAKNKHYGIERDPGITITLTSPPIKVEYISEITGVPKLLPVTNVLRRRNFVVFICTCNYTGLTHQLKFHFESGIDSIHLKPIGWSAEFLLERKD